MASLAIDFTFLHFSLAQNPKLELSITRIIRVLHGHYISLEEPA